MNTNGRLYEEDLDERDADIDPLMHELNDDPTEELQVPPSEFKNEMDKIAIDDLGRGDDDMREMIEDRDEGDDTAGVADRSG